MRELDYMYLLTPHYMSAMLKESEDYSFAIKGYHSAETAYNNLMYTNKNQILGYLIVYDELPFDLDDLIKYINFINEFGDKDTIVVLCVLKPDGLDEYLIPNIEYNNISFYTLSDIEVLTDLYIRANIFGTVIREKFEPYKNKFILGELSASYNRNSSLVPVLPNDILSILSPIYMLSVLDITIDNDKIMRNFRDNSLIGFMRLQRIRSFFDLPVDFKGMISRIKQTPSVDTVLYTTVAHVIHDKILNSGGVLIDRLSED